jgi:short-subunit dehydrogenase
MVHLETHQFGPWAIVTGASSGIGKEFARQLAADHFNLVLVARRIPLLNELAQQLTGDFGIQTRVIGADLSDEKAIDTIAAQTKDLDVGLLISNAGSGLPNDFLKTKMDDLNRIIRLNIQAHLDLIQHFGPKMVQRGRGGVVLLSAFGAAQGIPYMANDSATKAYVLSLGEALHEEFQKSGVHVSVILPGGVKTPVVGKLGIDSKSMPIKPITVEQCVRESLAALKANRVTLIPGRIFRIIAALMPSSMMTKMNGRMLGKAVAAKSANG